ncbi:hypothetical protein CDL15_Pgr008341 [Punica granatum]|uniref:Uncharacterized protein n=1 Tax=Punica granatum TaxID=22663 RepID=A0A218XSI4_PUNGR|nr:hypothetical protein CDL15_Pgr008341 [Punica granatum]
MARLAKVVGRNGAPRNLTRTREGSRALFLCNSDSQDWKLQMQKLSLEMDLRDRKHVGYEVWLKLAKVGGGRRKTVEFSSKTALEPGCALAVRFLENAEV